MGGDYEDRVEAPKPKRAAKGVEQSDASEVVIQGIRFHEARGQVHFHDDKAALKVYVPKAVWWREWQKLRSPLEGQASLFVHQDIDNGSFLEVRSTLDGDAVMVSMAIGTYTPPKAYGRVWHALENFTNRSASGS